MTKQIPFHAALRNELQYIELLRTQIVDGWIRSNFTLQPIPGRPVYVKFVMSLLDAASDKLGIASVLRAVADVTHYSIGKAIVERTRHHLTSCALNEHLLEDQIDWWILHWSGVWAADAIQRKNISQLDFNQWLISDFAVDTLGRRQSGDIDFTPILHGSIWHWMFNSGVERGRGTVTLFSHMCSSLDFTRIAHVGRPLSRYTLITEAVGECRHAVGHGLFYANFWRTLEYSRDRQLRMFSHSLTGTDRSLAQTVLLCFRIQDYQYRLQCASGVYHSYFQALAFERYRRKHWVRHCDGMPAASPCFYTLFRYAPLFILEEHTQEYCLPSVHMLFVRGLPCTIMKLTAHLFASCTDMAIVFTSDSHRLACIHAASATNSLWYNASCPEASEGIHRPARHSPTKLGLCESLLRRNWTSEHASTWHVLACVQGTLSNYMSAPQSQQGLCNAAKAIVQATALYAKHIESRMILRTCVKLEQDPSQMLRLIAHDWPLAMPS